MPWKGPLTKSNIIWQFKDTKLVVRFQNEDIIKPGIIRDLRSHITEVNWGATGYHRQVARLAELGREQGPWELEVTSYDHQWEGSAICQ